MLKHVHILLTYACTFECDHCFLYCSPRAQGTFTLNRLTELLIQAKETGTVESVYFEGGEPFLYYAQMVEGLKIASDMGFDTGIVTNGYWATSEEDAELWLRPLAELGVGYISMSDDSFHGGEETSPVKAALAAARKLAFPHGVIRINEPVTESDRDNPGRGEAIEGGTAKMRGRAVEKLTDGLSRHPADQFDACPFEDLETPERVHIDAYGNVHVCQGISIGNIWEKPLSAIFADYDAARHPVCGPLAEGGPARLAQSSAVPVDEGYVDACHLCFLTRRALIDRFPDQLAPRQVYGL